MRPFPAQADRVDKHNLQESGLVLDTAINKCKGQQHNKSSFPIVVSVYLVGFIDRVSTDHPA